MACMGCGGQVLTGGCVNPTCAYSMGGTYVNGVKVRTASGRSLVTPPWRAARHLTDTREGAYLVDCSMTGCDDPTHFGGSLEDSAKRWDSRYGR